MSVIVVDTEKAMMYMLYVLYVTYDVVLTCGEMDGLDKKFQNRKKTLDSGDDNKTTVMRSGCKVVADI